MLKRGLNLLSQSIVNRCDSGEDFSRAMDLIGELPLTVDYRGSDVGNLVLNTYPFHPCFFLLSPERSTVEYGSIEDINHRRFKVSFGRVGFEDKDSKDELFIQYKKHPRTGIFLRTHPFESS